MTEKGHSAKSQSELKIYSAMFRYLMMGRIE